MSTNTPRQKIGHELIVVGGILMVGSPALPDTEIGSPRSILVAVAGLFIAVGSFLAR